jgi:lipopolysaccharide export system protein LptA
MNKSIVLMLVCLSTLVLALPEDADQAIEIEAQTVVVNESTGFNEFTGNAVVKQGSLVLLAEVIQVQTNDDGVVSMVAKGTAENPAKYSQIQSNRARAIEASAILITYDVKKGMIYLVGDAYLMQGFDSFSGETLDYDIDNDKVLVKGSEDGTKRVKFIIKM